MMHQTGPEPGPDRDPYPYPDSDRTKIRLSQAKGDWKMKLNNGEYSFCRTAPGRTNFDFTLSHAHTYTSFLRISNPLFYVWVCFLRLLVAVSCFANFSLYCINIYCNSISQAIEMPFAPLIQCNTCQRRLGFGSDFSTANFCYFFFAKFTLLQVGQAPWCCCFHPLFSCPALGFWVVNSEFEKWSRAKIFVCL